MIVINSSDAAIDFPRHGGDNVYIGPHQEVDVEQGIHDQLLSRYGFLTSGGMNEKEERAVPIDAEFEEIDYESEYKRLTGIKKIPAKWKPETLEKKVKELKEEEGARMEEAKESNEKMKERIGDKGNIVMKDGKPYMILDGKYVPYEQGEAKLLEKKIESDTKKLNNIKK